MMLSDAFASLSTRGRLAFNRDGVLSRPGVVVEAVVRDVLAHPFVRRRPPKSTGREDFGRHFFEPLFRRHRRVAASDMARSLLAATARVLCLTASRDRRIQGLKEIVLSGGGAEIRCWSDEVTRCFPETKVLVVTSGVFAPACHEPAAMALIAARTLSRLPSSLPAVTGASRPAILGHVAWPSR